MKRFVLAVSLAVVSASAWTVACLDMTLLTPPPVPDAGPTVTPIPDGGPDAPDVDTRPSCERCIETPEDAGGCDTEVAACLANPTCSAIYACALQKACFERGTARAGITCGLPCAQSAGVADPSDPAVGLVYDIITCAGLACRGRCFPEAGAPADASATD